MHDGLLDTVGYLPQTDQLGEWVKLYNQRLLRLAFGLLNDEYAAQDCVQEAFIKAGIKAHQLRNVDKPLTWLAKIVVNECRSWHKKNSRNKLNSVDVGEIAIEDDYPSLKVSRLREIVADLPYKLRTAIQLFYWADYSTVEIAEIMNVSDATCRVWLHRGRPKIKKQLGGMANE